MKKSIGILVLALNLIGCQGGVTKSGSAKLPNTVIDEQYIEVHFLEDLFILE